MQREKETFRVVYIKPPYLKLLESEVASLHELQKESESERKRFMQITLMQGMRRCTTAGCCRDHAHGVGGAELDCACGAPTTQFTSTPVEAYVK